MDGYSNQIKHYHHSGMHTEHKMWEAIEVIEEALCELKKHDEEAYWDVICETHEIYAGPHFNEHFAKHVVGKMHHKHGNYNLEGEHYSMNYLKQYVTDHNIKIPGSYNYWDLYVAANATWHDKCEMFKEWFHDEKEYEQRLIEDTLEFFMLDDDAPDGKVWKYIFAMN